MGLNDLIPDDSGTSSSSTSTKSKPPEEQEDKVVIGKGETKKVFDEERWERIKRVIIDEMGLIPNKVVNNYPADERYNIIHEAAMLLDEKTEPEESDYSSTTRCAICGKAADDAYVEIEGLIVHTNHTAGQIESELNNE